MRLYWWIILLMSLWLAGCGPIEVGFVVTPTASATVLVEPTVQIVATRTPTPTATVSATPTDTLEPTDTLAPPVTPVPPTNTRRPIVRPPSGTPAPTFTPTPSVTPTMTPSPTLSVTPGPSPTSTPCAHTWFFTAPVPDRCAEGPALRSVAAAESFERGRMIWIQATDNHYVFIGLTSGSFRKFAGPLPGDPNNRIGTPPPPGTFEPVSGFGLIWRGEVPGSEGVRDQIGWALEPEFNYTAIQQCEVKVGDVQKCFLSLPNGALVEFSGSSWKQW